MKKIRCIILDDEPLAVDLLLNYASKLPRLEIALATTDVYAAIAYMQNNKVDLFFIDIQMPELSGIKIMELFNKDCQFIITSAYANYALKSYEFRVVDYLLKPISFDKFHKAVTKYLEFGNDAKDLDNCSLFVKVDGKQVRVNTSEIYFVEGLSDYIRIHFKTERLIVYDTLKGFITKLPANNFMRIHKSYIVNISKIKSVDGNSIRHELGLIPIGETYKNEVKNWIENQ